MRLVLGVDEAGYGPNLGPFVIALSQWEIDSQFDVLQGLEPFAPEFRDRAISALKADSEYIPLGDSKKIYQPGVGLGGLDLALRFLGQESHQGVSMKVWGDADLKRVESRLWYDPKLAQRWEDSFNPASSESAEDSSGKTALFQRGREKFRKLGISFGGFRMRIIDEQFFNEECHRCGNKSNVLGEMSLGLVFSNLKRLVEAGESTWESVEIYCDRQGGKKRYASLLSHAIGENFPEESNPWIDVLEETPHVSRYGTIVRGLPITIRFQVDGDSLFPSAASSMAAKWVREVLMDRLNRYWHEVTGGTVRPTAGYSVDAHRFEKEITPWLISLGVIREHWWRLK
jgi:ribonuclease HII